MARHGARVRLSAAARARARAANRVVRRLAGSDTPLYGVTTGSGANVGVPIPAAQRERFQVNLVTSHCVGVGPPLPTDAVRGLLLVAAHRIGLGRTGASPRLAELMVACLNGGIHPIVPGTGSVGMADLAPMAHAALPLLGLGEVEQEGRRRPAAEALAAAGLKPLRLGPKDGLTLTSSGAPSLAAAALAAEDAAGVLAGAEAAAALAIEGFQAAPASLDARLLDLLPHPAAAAVAGRLRGLLAGGRLERSTAPRLQDPLSYRCIPQVHGTSAEALGRLRELARAEINGSPDSPLVLAEENTVVSHGGFHSGRLALALEGLTLALGQQAIATANRVFRLHSPRFTGFPAYLAPEPGLNCGFATLQKTVAALVAEIRHLGMPSSLDGLAVAEGQEDLGVPSLAAALKLARALDRLGHLVACELLAGAQAIDLLGGPERLGAGTRRVYAAVRERAGFLDADRPLTPEIERVAGLVAGGEPWAAGRHPPG